MEMAVRLLPGKPIASPAEDEVDGFSRGGVCSAISPSR
jgi:hypothetical protein